MCGPRQLFFQCGPKMPKCWTPLLITTCDTIVLSPAKRLTDGNWGCSYTAQGCFYFNRVFKNPKARIRL